MVVKYLMLNRNYIALKKVINKYKFISNNFTLGLG